MNKIRIAIDSSMMDGRHGKGTAMVVENIVHGLLKYREEFDFTLVHKHKQPEAKIYQEYSEIIIPRIWNHFLGGLVNEFLFFVNFWIKIFLGRERKFDIYFVAYSRVLPTFFLAPAKKIMFFPMDGGPKTANLVEIVTKTPFPWYVRLFKNKINYMLALTDFGKRGIVEQIKVDPSKVETLLIAAPDNFVKNNDLENVEKIKIEKYNLPKKYILCVSRWDPHKNILRLVEAYANYRKIVQDPLPLVFVGGKHMQDYSAIVDKKISDLELSKFIFMSKYVEEKDLSSIYSGAEFNIFPSLYEGFGVPVLEAQISGCPILISSDEALMEVAGTAAVVMSRRNIQDMTIKIKEMHENLELRQILIKNGYENLKRFSWEITTQNLVKIFRKIVI